MVERGRRQRNGGPWGLSDVKRRRADGQKEVWSWKSMTLDMVWFSMETRADCDGGGEGRARMGRGKGHWNRDDPISRPYRQVKSYTHIQPLLNVKTPSSYTCVCAQPHQITSVTCTLTCLSPGTAGLCSVTVLICLCLGQRISLGKWLSPGLQARPLLGV